MTGCSIPYLDTWGSLTNPDPPPLHPDQLTLLLLQSEHVFIEAELHVSRVNIKSKTRYNFAKGDYVGMQIELSKVEIKYANDVNKVWRNLRQSLTTNVTENYVQLLKFKHEYKAVPLVNSNTKAISAKKKAWVKF